MGHIPTCCHWLYDNKVGQNNVTDAARRMVKEKIVKEKKAKHDEVEIHDKSTPIYVPNLAVAQKNRDLAYKQLGNPTFRKKKINLLIKQCYFLMVL